MLAKKDLSEFQRLVCGVVVVADDVVAVVSVNFTDFLFLKWRPPNKSLPRWNTGSKHSRLVNSDQVLN